jgi:hypothetical protein
VLGNRATPCDVAGISWSDLGKEETSTGRVDPICADKDITPFRAPARKAYSQTKGTGGGQESEGRSIPSLHSNVCQ